MDACSQIPTTQATCDADVAGRRVERWMWLEEDAESLRARAPGRLQFGALTGALTGAPTGAPTGALTGAPTQGDPWLADGLGVLDAVDDLVAAMIDADEVCFSRCCEALFRSVVGTRCLAALATRRLARVVNSRWFPVLMQVTPRRRLLGMRVLALHRTLAGMVPDGARPATG